MSTGLLYMINIEEIKNCQKCPLAKTRHQVVVGTGPIPADIMLIGEAPGEEEDRSGVPFSGSAGHILSNLLDSAGIDRDSVFITNTVLCRPPNNRTPNKAEAAACNEWLVQYIEEVKPKLIGLLGSVPLGLFFPEYKISQVSGLHISRYGYNFLPLYHPAAMLHNPRLKSRLEQDYKQLSHIPNNNPKAEDFRWAGEYFVLGECFIEDLQESSTVAVDIETLDLTSKKLLGIGISCHDQGSMYFPMPDISRALEIISNPNRTKIYQNGLFDLDVLTSLYPSYKEGLLSNVVDTINISNQLGTPRALAAAAPMIGAEAGESYLLGIDKDTKQVAGSTEDVALKCCKDALATYKLYVALLPQANPEQFSIDNAMIPILIRMSQRGLLLDQVWLKDLINVYQSEVDFYYGVCAQFGFNPGSALQIIRELTRRGNYLPKTAGKKWLDTNEEVLSKLDDPLVPYILGYRHAKKRLSTNLLPLRGKERAYSRFHMDAATSRISSVNINLQNIPKGPLRGVFIPDTGIFSNYDQSQIELRILANISQDIHMLNIFSDPKGDIHKATAAAIFDISETQVTKAQREIGKLGNFATNYQVGDEGLAEKLGVSLDKAKEVKVNLVRAFPQAWDWIHSMIESEDIYNIFGYKIASPDGKNLGEVQRKRVNYPIQHSAAYIQKRLMLREQDKDITHQVYDELIFDGRVYLENPILDIAPFPVYVESKGELKRWK